MPPPEDLAQPVGIWRALGEFKIKDALWPEGFFGLVLGAGGSVLVVTATKEVERASAVSTVLVLSGAFFGIVFAALAIVVSLPSASYLRMVQGTPGGGMRRFLDPFLVATGTQVALLLLSVAYQLLASHVSPSVEHVVFVLIGFLFVFGVLDIAGLARQLVRHGVLRAVDAELEVDHQEQSDGSVRRLPRRG